MRISFIDTRHGLVDNDEKIGEAIQGMRREDLVFSPSLRRRTKKLSSTT